MNQQEQKKTVLIVDDAPSNLQMVNSILKGSYNVRIATGGAKALEIVKAAPQPDLILLDVMMPGMDGYEVCTRLKTDAETRDIPVIFLTGQTETQDETRGFDVGAVDYIHKPFSPAVVKARVQTHLVLRATREQLAMQLSAIQKELETARQIQFSILPHQIPQLQGLDIAARYIPMSAVAGDFYDFLVVDDKHIGLLIADVSGHGMPAALIASMLKIRELSGGKPIGFKLCVGHKSEFLAICKAMVKTGIYPDFITVDGGEGGTGAAPLEFSNSVGMPLREALAFVYDALTGFDIKKHIKLIASGKVATGFDLVKNFAIGADMCNSARGMMFALGCIQALECNMNTCPTGVATQDKSLMRGLVVDDKKVRVANFHKATVGSAIQMIGAAGLTKPCDLHRMFIYRRINHSQIQTYAELFPYIPKGSLLNTPYPASFELDMALSSEHTFLPDYSVVTNIDYSNVSSYTV